MNLWGIYTLKRSFTVTWKPPIFFSPKAGSFEIIISGLLALMAMDFDEAFQAFDVCEPCIWERIRWTDTCLWFGKTCLQLRVQHIDSLLKTIFSLTDVDRQWMASTTRVSCWTCVQCTHASLYSCTVYSAHLYNYISYNIVIANFPLFIPCRWFFHQAGRLWCLQSSRRNHRGRSPDAIDVCLFSEIHPPSGSCDHRWHVSAWGWADGAVPHIIQPIWQLYVNICTGSW